MLLDECSHTFFSFRLENFVFFHDFLVFLFSRFQFIDFVFEFYSTRLHGAFQMFSLTLPLPLFSFNSGLLFLQRLTKFHLFYYFFVRFAHVSFHRSFLLHFLFFALFKQNFELSHFLVQSVRFRFCFSYDLAQCVVDDALHFTRLRFQLVCNSFKPFFFVHLLVPLRVCL